VAAYVNIFAIGAAIREPMSQTRMAAVAAGTGSQPRHEEQNRASQITARLIRNGQAHRAMRVKFPARLSNRLDRTTKGKQDRRILWREHSKHANHRPSFTAVHYSLLPWRLSSAQVEVLY